MWLQPFQPYWKDLILLSNQSSFTNQRTHQKKISLQLHCVRLQNIFRHWTRFSKKNLTILWVQTFIYDTLDNVRTVTYDILDDFLFRRIKNFEKKEGPSFCRQPCEWYRIKSSPMIYWSNIRIKGDEKSYRSTCTPISSNLLCPPPHMLTTITTQKIQTSNRKRQRKWTIILKTVF